MFDEDELDEREDDERGLVPDDEEPDEGPETEEGESEAEEQQTEEEPDQKRKRPSRAERRIKKLHAELQSTKEQLRRMSEEHVKQLETVYSRLKDSSTNSTNNLDQQLNNLYVQRKAAFDAADGDKWEAVDREIKKLERQSLLNSLKREEPPPRVQPLYNEEPTAPNQPSKAELGWVRRNPWFNKPGHKMYTDAAFEMWSELKEEGWDSDDPELYEELDKQIQTAYPHLAAKPGKRPAARSAVSTGSKGVSTNPVKSKDKLTDKDLEAMKRYHFGDPNNPKDRQEYLKYGKQGVV